MLAVRLPKDMEEALNLLAARTNRSKSYYVKQALEVFLEDKADYELAAEAYKEHLASGGKTHSFDDVMQQNGLNANNEG